MQLTLPPLLAWMSSQREDVRRNIEGLNRAISAGDYYCGENACLWQSHGPYRLSVDYEGKGQRTSLNSRMSENLILQTRYSLEGPGADGKNVVLASMGEGIYISRHGDNGRIEKISFVLSLNFAQRIPLTSISQFEGGPLGDLIALKDAMFEPISQYADRTIDNLILQSAGMNCALLSTEPSDLANKHLIAARKAA